MNANALKEKRIGVMLHYSEGSFRGTADWCRTPKPKNPNPVSYNRLIGPHGETDHIVPEHLRAWHAGTCRPSDPRLAYIDANSAFEGIALSGGPQFGPPTARQIKVLVEVIRERFKANGWPLSETWRITSHDREAWPRGRKHDVTGPDTQHPWLDLHTIREAVAK